MGPPTLQNIRKRRLEPDEVSSRFQEIRRDLEAVRTLADQVGGWEEGWAGGPEGRAHAVLRLPLVVCVCVCLCCCSCGGGRS